MILKWPKSIFSLSFLVQKITFSPSLLCDSDPHLYSKMLARPNYKSYYI